jgi:hypothetical protein
MNGKVRTNVMHTPYEPASAAHLALPEGQTMRDKLLSQPVSERRGRIHNDPINHRPLFRHGLSRPQEAPIHRHRAVASARTLRSTLTREPAFDSSYPQNPSPVRHLSGPWWIDPLLEPSMPYLIDKRQTSAMVVLRGEVSNGSRGLQRRRPIER